MGTKWHIALYSQDAESANVAFERAFARIAEIDRDLTNYGNDSELNQLCRGAPHASPVRVGNHLWRCLQAADALSRRSHGAFDVTIGPLTKLWRRARVTKRAPEAERLEEARQGVGYDAIEYDTSTQSVRLTRPHMQLDLGGIAKGYAVDQAIAVVVESGIASVLVNGGGDLAVADPPPGELGWLTEIESLTTPSDAQSSHASRNGPAERYSVRLAHQALATSGDAYQFVEIEGVRYSHLVDPQTGRGTTHRSSVTVLARTCMQADAWASALSILPVAEGIPLAESEPDLDALIITIEQEAPRQVRTSHFPGAAQGTPQRKHYLRGE